MRVGGLTTLATRHVALFCKDLCLIFQTHALVVAMAES